MIQTISPNDDLVIDVVLTDRSGNVIEDSLIANLQFVVFTEETSELQRVYLSSSRYTDGKLYINSSELATLTSGQLYLTTAIALLNSQYNDGSFDYIKTNALPYYLRNNITSVTDDEAMLSWKIDVTKSLQDINATLKSINSRLLNVEAAAGDSSAITEMINTALEGYATIEYVDGQDSSIVNSIPDAVDLTPYATTDEVTAAIRAIPEPDLTPYATTADVSIALSGKADTTDIPDLEPYALKTSIPSIQGLATFDYVDQAVADVSVDLTGYATESYVDEHDASVANAIPSISGLATETFVTQQIGNIDLTPYATTADVSTALAGKADTADIPSLEGYATDASVAEAIAAIPTVDLSPYATTADVSTALAGKADTADIPSLEGYATDASVAEAIAAIPSVDLTPYATTADVSTALGSKVDTSQLENVEYSVAVTVNRLTERVENIETTLLDEPENDGSEDDGSENDGSEDSSVGNSHSIVFNPTETYATSEDIANGYIVLDNQTATAYLDNNGGETVTWSSLTWDDSKGNKIYYQFYDESIGDNVWQEDYSASTSMMTHTPESGQFTVYLNNFSQNVHYKIEIPFKHTDGNSVEYEGTYIVNVFIPGE